MSQNRIHGLRIIRVMLRFIILLVIMSTVLLAQKSNIFASANIMGNYLLLRPGETDEIHFGVSIPTGDTYHYASSDPSIFTFDRYTKDGKSGRIAYITAKRRGTAEFLISSKKSGIVARMTVQVANYKQYFGFSSKYSKKNAIKKITISGNRLIIDGSPKVVTKNGIKKLKYKKSRVFKLTKDTYYGIGDGGVWVYKGKKAKRDAKNTWKAPILHVCVVGNKVIEYHGSS